MSYQAIQYPVYQPAMRTITSITNAYPAVVTTGDISYPGGVTTITPFVNQYVDGMIVRLLIPWSYGMNLADQQYGQITIIDPSTFSIDIDTSTYDPFVIPAAVLLPSGLYVPPVVALLDGSIVIEEYAQVIPFAQDNAILTAAVRNVLPY